MKLKLGLVEKITLLILLFTLLVITSVSYQNYLTARNYFKQLEGEKIETLLDSTVPVVGFQLSMDLPQNAIGQLRQLIEANPNVRSVSLLGPAKTPIYETINPQSIATESVIVTKREIFDPLNGQRQGTVVIRTTTAKFDALITQYRTFTLVLALMLSIAALLFIYLLRQTLNPLQKLAKQVVDYTPEHVPEGLQPSNRTDEIGTINNAIVDMVDRIEHYTQMLGNTNERLEILVDERTRELDRKNSELTQKIEINKQIYMKLEESNLKLKELTRTDPLTQLSNRRHFEEQFNLYFALCQSRNEPLGLIMCDIDYFKKINDTYGHTFGDKCLRRTANAIAEAIETTPYLASRYGGEEFIVLMPLCAKERTIEISKKIERSITAIDDAKLSAIFPRGLTVSQGIYAAPVTSECSQELLIMRADDALYHAKNNGRKQAILYDDGTFITL